MSTYLKTWERVLEQFETDYPHIIDKMVDWYPSGRNEITVITKNCNYLYNYIERRLKTLEKIVDENHEVNEELWRKNFAEQLLKKMSYAGMSQWELSRSTGISEVSLSRYMNARATPSGYNIERIAAALKCSSSELTRLY